MSLSNYPIHYYGNKYLETKKHLLKYDYSKFNIICEPYCGIYGFSRAIFKLVNNKCLFFINDINKDLILLHKYFANNTIDIILNDIKNVSQNINLDSLNDRNIVNLKYDEKYGKYEAFLFITANNLGSTKLHVKKGINIRLNNIGKIEIYRDFFKRCSFFNMDAKEFVKYVMDNFIKEKILFFFDPPYFDSANQSYINVNDNTQSDTRIFINDNTNMYIDIIDLLKENNKKISILLIINKNGLIDYIYKDYIIEFYKKTYSQTIGKKKRETFHNVVGKNLKIKKSIL